MIAVKTIIILFLFLLNVLLVIDCSYNANLKDFYDCEQVDWPYENENERTLKVDYEIYKVNNKSLIKGNITISGDTSKFLGFAKLYSIIDNKRILRLEMTNLTCHSPLVTVGMRMLKQIKVDVKLNRATCVAVKKTYSFKGLDMDKIEHLIPTTWHAYGTIIWQGSFISNKKTVICLEAVLEIEPPQ